jgi:predicted nucleic-acid-binding Zn-ribbon protein|tara:strand:- start:1744 stop:1971 length:228 start_codon:yes stop_codon:yes gene_type:complete
MGTEPENIANYECPKCHNGAYETGTIRTTGGGLSRFLDIQNQQFSHITCANCGYTEFFKRRAGMAGNILDMFLGG